MNNTYKVKKTHLVPGLFSEKFCTLPIPAASINLIALSMYHLHYPCWPFHRLYLHDSFSQGPTFVYILASSVRMCVSKG